MYEQTDRQTDRNRESAVLVVWVERGEECMVERKRERSMSGGAARKMDRKREKEKDGRFG